MKSQRITASLDQYELDLFNEAIAIIDPEGTFSGAKQLLFRFALLAVSREVIKNEGLIMALGVDMRAETAQETHDRVNCIMPQRGSDIYIIKKNPNLENVAGLVSRTNGRGSLRSAQPRIQTPQIIRVDFRNPHDREEATP